MPNTSKDAFEQNSPSPWAAHEYYANAYAILFAKYGTPDPVYPDDWGMVESGRVTGPLASWKTPEQVTAEAAAKVAPAPAA